MKKSKKFLVILLCIGLLSTALMLNATTPAPGSEADPLVTRSYVERLISESGGFGGGSLSNQQMDAIINEVANRIAAQGITNDTFTPIHMTSGQTMFANEGTEIILRSGSAVVQANGVDGLSNVTIGRDITVGESVERNHLLIVPRTDGRGIHATSDIWVLVKGGYTIH